MAKPHDFQSWLEGPFRARLDKASRRRAPQLPAPQVLVVTPAGRFAYGETELPFHCASVGKLFTAVLIGRQIERGDYRLDTPIGDILPRHELSALPAAPGVDFASEVTIEHLLSHRSGLQDPIEPLRAARVEDLLVQVQREPNRYWSRADLLALTHSMPAIGRPGERFGYSDAAYALLLRVAEVAAGVDSEELLRTEVFARAGMTQTHRPHNAGPEVDLAAVRMAPVFLGDTDMSRARAASAVSSDGGAVTTVDDLHQFNRALASGDLISPELRERLMRPQSKLRAGIHYGAGFVTLKLGEFMPLVLRGLSEPVGGLGLSAVHTVHYREQDVFVALNFHATHEMGASFEAQIALARALKQFGGRA
ncbi:class C beta-lactamase-related serine hydrolase [Gulosibacter macacae]|uniref:Class C beta-lactamase-related serine hydrolase n=1 Tax=Gulosibacter macacae TaxID=2488791 RepID=A0A3P3W151_9MICO|nr:serine hydrolase [Gulosibacter macacae]RRJ88700.1 class C beta-lactamase-related serine hydrolase [Gulosibacter macacae]